MAETIKTVTFKEAKVGDYLYLPKPGVSYRSSCVAVFAIDGDAIALTHVDKRKNEVINSETFNERQYAPVTADEVNAYFKDRERERQ